LYHTVTQTTASAKAEVYNTVQAANTISPESTQNSEEYLEDVYIHKI